MTAQAGGDTISVAATLTMPEMSTGPEDAAKSGKTGTKHSIPKRKRKGYLTLLI
jgi:hypothetical protein